MLLGEQMILVYALRRQLAALQERLAELEKPKDVE